MSSHIHMVAGRETGDPGELLGRFKSYIAKSIIKMIQAHSKESRKTWMLNLFKHFAVKNTQYADFHFWNYGNHSTELWNPEVILQKIEYIHQNPVRAGIVSHA